jgi:hypothetical protein
VEPRDLVGATEAEPGASTVIETPLSARLAAAGILALGIVALCSACGSKERMFHGRPAFTACDVMRTFHEVTGKELPYRHHVDLTRLGVGSWDDVGMSEAGTSPYGEFTFFVDVEPITLPGISDPSPVEHPDSRGIYWSFEPAERPGEVAGWSARKYRRNVKLGWFNGTKTTNANWETLNRVLESLTHRTSPCS